jgi:hypothetical protein
MSTAGSSAAATKDGLADPGARRDWQRRELHDRSFWRWARRARVAASLLQQPAQRWVCDIGCGRQHLKWFLPRDAVYLPADVAAWTPDVEVCDLDNDDLPVRSLAVCDVAALLGVIAYLEAPERALRGIARFAEHLLLSYRTTELSPVRRPYWTNAYSLAELTEVLNRAGFEIATLRTYNGQVVLLARNGSFRPEQAERRAAARATYPAARRQSLGDTLQRLYFNVCTRDAIRQALR